MRRATFAVIVALAVGLAGFGATTLGGAVDADAGVTVGSERLPVDAIEAAAARLAGGRPRRLLAARRAAATRAIERLWLEGEAAERGLRLDSAVAPRRLGRGAAPSTHRADVDVALLRGEVADALAGARPERDASRFAKAFSAFHERWRSRTRCEIAYHDPYEDRCGNRAGSTAGTCQWMGEATLCALSGDRRDRWLVVQDAASARASWRAAQGLPRPLASRLKHARSEAGSLVVRLGSRTRAVALARAVYASARAARKAASARARRVRAADAAERAAAADRETRARERAARRRDPRLSEPALSAARSACARQVADSDPYMFGFGMQDVIGGAEGLIAARAALTRRLVRSAQDVFDRRKLQQLVKAVGEGNRELARLAAAEAAGDRAAAAGLVARLDAHTQPERALAQRLGLGDCLVRPAR
jgi:hypothetical protein